MGSVTTRLETVRFVVIVVVVTGRKNSANDSVQLCGLTKIIIPNQNVKQINIVLEKLDEWIPRRNEKQRQKCRNTARKIENICEIH